MNNAKLAKKYGVKRREIQYWTDIGLLTPEELKTGGINGTYDYGDKAEEEIRIILIVKAMGVKGPIEETVKAFNSLPKKMWKQLAIHEIEQQILNLTKNYQQALQYAKEIGD